LKATFVPSCENTGIIALWMTPSNPGAGRTAPFLVFMSFASRGPCMPGTFGGYEPLVVP